MQGNTELETLLATVPREQLMELALKGLLNQPQSTPTNRIDIESLIKKHTNYQVSREVCDNTQNIYKSAYKYLRMFTAERGIKHADEFTYDLAEEFYNFIKDTYVKENKRLTRTSAITFYKCIKAAFHYAERRGYIVKNRFENKVFPASQVTQWWTDRYVYEQLIPAIKKHAKKGTMFAIELKVRLTYTTGLRAGIIHSIRRKDVVYEEEVDTVYVNTKCKVPKSSEIQRITSELLDNTTRDMMKIYVAELDQQGIEAEERIFAKSQPRTAYHTYRQSLIKICKKANITYLRPHGAKHGFITKMAKAGFSAEQICRLTGNRTPSLVQKVYMHLQIGDIKDRAKEVINNTS